MKELQDKMLSFYKILKSENSPQEIIKLMLKIRFTIAAYVLIQTEKNKEVTDQLSKWLWMFSSLLKTNRAVLPLLVILCACGADPNKTLTSKITNDPKSSLDIVK